MPEDNPAAGRVAMKKVLVCLVLGVAGCQWIFDIDPEVVVCDEETLATNARHCGACGHDCGGGACEAGRCQPLLLAESSGTPTDVAVDESHVFFASEDGSLGRVGKGGRDPKSLVTGVSGGIGRMTVAQSFVFFRDRSASPVLHAVGKDGTNLRTAADDQPGLGALTSHAGWLYWSRVDGTNVGSVQRSPIGPNAELTPVEVIADRQFPEELASDGERVFWNESFQDLVEHELGAGGAPSHLACKGAIVGLVADDTHVYAATDSGLVFSVPKGDAASECSAPPNLRTLADDPAGGAAGIALSSSRVVWSDPKTGELWSAPKSGNCASPPCAERLAGDQKQPGRVTADANAVYWVNTGDRRVMKLVL